MTALGASPWPSLGLPDHLVTAGLSLPAAARGPQAYALAASLPGRAHSRTEQPIASPGSGRPRRGPASAAATLTRTAEQGARASQGRCHVGAGWKHFRGSFGPGLRSWRRRAEAPAEPMPKPPRDPRGLPAAAPALAPRSPAHWLRGRAGTRPSRRARPRHAVPARGEGLVVPRTSRAESLARLGSATDPSTATIRGYKPNIKCQIKLD